MAERCRTEVIVGIRELGMIQSIKKLNAKLQAASFLRPSERDSPGNREVKIRLVWPIHYAGRAVSEGRPNSVCSNNRGCCKTRLVEVIVEL